MFDIFKKTVFWLLVLMTISSIFYFSTESAKLSANRTRKLTQSLVVGFGRTIKADSDIKMINFDKLHHYIRKGAHFSEYLILAILLSVSLRNGKRGAFKQIIIILLMCIIFACVDESIQLFTDGRAGRITDVIIDSSGALMGIVFYNIVCIVIFKFRFILLHGINVIMKKGI